MYSISDGPPTTLTIDRLIRVINSYYYYYTTTYDVLALGSFIGKLALRLGCLAAAVYMHEAIVHGIVRAPLEFFDKTPTGRILSRFSKDVDVLDATLPMYLSDMITCLFEVSPRKDKVYSIKYMEGIMVLLLNVVICQFTFKISVKKCSLSFS